MPALLQVFLRLVALKRLGVLLFALAATLCATSTASAFEPAQTKTRVWDFVLAGNNSSGLLSAATSGKHQGNRFAQSEVMSGSLLAAEGAGAVLRSMCFATGTKILMADGSTKSIEDVREGDEVLADDPQDSAGLEARAVTQVHRTATYRLFHVELGDGSGGEIVATGSHPFWTRRGWVTAEELSTNDTLSDEAGQPVPVRAIAVESRDARTYNLSIEGTHTFFVVAGSTPVLVHNVDPWDVLYTQNSYGPTFQNGPWAGRSVTEAIAEARAIGRLPAGLELRAMRMGDGSWAALNNRTLGVAQRANLTNVSVTEVGAEAMNEFNAKLSESGLSGPVENALMRCK